MSTFTVLGFAQVADSNNKIENVFNPPNIDNGRKKIVFNDDGIGLLYGHQIVGQIKTDDETKIIYKFVIYRTTDGISWKELKNSVLTKALSDTTSALGPRVVQSYSNGKQLLLSSKSFLTYTSKDGLSWEMLNYSGKDIQDFRKNNIGTIWSSMFHVNSFSHYLCFNEFGNVNMIFKNENGNWKKIQKEKIDSSVNSETPRITIHVGRKTVYHAFDGYFFMKKQWPHYIFESNREVLKLAQNNELLKKSYGGTYSYPEEVFMPYMNAKIIYARFASNIFVSNDGGISFHSLKNKIPFWPIDKIFNLCSDGSIFVAGAEKNGGYGKIWRSNDGGNTWKAIIDIRGSYLKSDPENFDLDFLPDGKVIIVANSMQSGIYVLKQGCGLTNTDPYANIVFGTTIITHGYQLGGTPPTGQNDWTFQMALEIIKKCGKGTIKIYDKSTGSFKTDTEVGVGGETVLLFDWAAESDDNSHGYSEAAGDALFAALMMEQKKGNVKLENLHLIGHSRGAVVNSECVLRLLSAGVAVDHVTYLDPHDWGVNVASANIVNDFDVHPELPGIPGKPNSHQAVIGWSGVGFCDTYYQDAGFEDGNCGTCFGGLEGRKIKGSNPNLWNYYGLNKICHSNIHSCGYTNSIILPNAVKDKEGGYKYARLGGNERPSSSNAQPEAIDADFFFGTYNFKSPDGTSFQRIKGVLNGSFDRGINEYSQNLPTTPGGQPQGYYYALLPGWQYHGGSNPSESVEYKADHVVLSNTLTPKNIKSLLRHNRFFVPKEAKAISFKYKSLKPEKGKLNIKIQSQTSLKSREFPISLEKINPSYIEHYIDVSEFSQDVITLEFELISTSNGNLSVALDDVRFDKNKSTFSANSNPQSSNQTQTTQQPTPIKEQLNSLPTTIENSDFSNNSGWETLEGDAEFKNGFVTLNPKKNKAVMSFESSNFQIPDYARTLSIKADKSEIGKGEIKVYIVTEGVEENVHTEKIDNSLNKAIKIIADTDKALETGNLPEKKTSRTFERLNIDISKYKGKAVKVKVTYESKGMIKAKLYLNEVTLK